MPTTKIRKAVWAYKIDRQVDSRYSRVVLEYGNPSRSCGYLASSL
jgi:hypothetical protein